MEGGGVIKVFESSPVGFGLFLGTHSRWFPKRQRTKWNNGRSLLVFWDPSPMGSGPRLRFDRRAAIQKYRNNLGMTTQQSHANYVGGWVCGDTWISYFAFYDAAAWYKPYLLLEINRMYST